ncbi:RNA-binding domain-containing protein [Candidatus Symbiothrix dinenymphae]|uniref:RNA-binding domain-containing protein n=1 Tax=Candidatus Symbiothrix dinenymphae TaxID=467085 RepID=UPI0006C0A400|nr:RNA-binding domain-containing protein [Candidatus Symbiothrix dinenymphae]GAP71242.1 transcriptional regulator [Candidatus Symbiothrix dinenymphae]
MINAEKIKSIIAQGEGLNVEFKTAHSVLPRSVFETICAFLNRKGGHILLGVKDNGHIEGIMEDSLPTQLKTLADDMNNPKIISPTFYLTSEVVEIDEKKIICIYVPESSQAHTHLNIYYDRNHEGDYRLMTNHQISTLFLRKFDGYTENKVFPYLQMSDFVQEDFDTVRNIVSANTGRTHPWLKMSNEEILRSSKLYRKDDKTGQEGYTMAAALLFGTDVTVGTVCPHYRIDALCRKDDVERYDDRDVIECNLIQAYDRLMAFVQKHTPDRFFLEGIQRKSIRDIIFREMICNLLIHREYAVNFHTSLTVFKETVVTENWNIPYNMGQITPENLKPHSKNPNIAAFFRQLEWVEDLGSGVKKMFHYCPLYLNDKNALPVMEESDVFKLTIRYEKEGYETFDFERVSNIKHADKVLKLIQENPKMTIIEMSQRLSVTTRTIKRIIAQLAAEKIIERNGSKKDGYWVILFKMSL